MTDEEIIAIARQANVPDTSCTPAGELMQWVRDFARLVQQACAAKENRND